MECGKEIEDSHSRTKNGILMHDRIKTIHKYPLEITDHQTIKLPSDYRILTVDIQDGKPYLWAAVDLDSPMGQAEINIVGTGHPVDTENCSVDYISTFFLKETRLGYHTFHITE